MRVSTRIPIAGLDSFFKEHAVKECVVKPTGLWTTLRKRTSPYTKPEVEASPLPPPVRSRLDTFPTHLLLSRREIQSIILPPATGARASWGFPVDTAQATAFKEKQLKDKFGVVPVEALKIAARKPSPQDISEVTDLERVFRYMPGEIRTQREQTQTSLAKAFAWQVPQHIQAKTVRTRQEAEAQRCEAQKDPVYAFFDPPGADVPIAPTKRGWFGRSAGTSIIHEPAWRTWPTPEAARKRLFMTTVPIDVDAPWGVFKVAARNIIAIDQALEGYPWPNPGDMFYRAFVKVAGPELRKRAAYPQPLSAETARDLVTTLSVAHMRDIVDDVNRQIEEKKRRAKRKALMKKIAFGLMSAISLVAPAAAGAFMSLMMTAGQSLQQVQAIKKMEEMALAFEKRDKGFADEIRRVTGKYGLTQEDLELLFDPRVAEAAAIMAETPVDDEPEAADSALLLHAGGPDRTLLYVGIGAGVLVLGIVAYLILRKK